jgi:hypothetical protein
MNMGKKYNKPQIQEVQKIQLEILVQKHQIYQNNKNIYKLDNQYIAKGVTEKELKNTLEIYNILTKKGISIPKYYHTIELKKTRSNNSNGKKHIFRIIEFYEGKNIEQIKKPLKTEIIQLCKRELHKVLDAGITPYGSLKAEHCIYNPHEGIVLIGMNNWGKTNKEEREVFRNKIEGLDFFMNG